MWPAGLSGLYAYANITSHVLVRAAQFRSLYNILASSPGRPLEEGRAGIDCLRMRGVFRILSSKFDRKLNYARRARTL